jgi:thioredoxin-related protein
MLMLSCEKKPRAESAVEDETTLPTPVKDDRPPITIRLTDGTDLKVKEQNRKMVLVLFQPDCDHCQDQAKQIRKRLEAFKDYRIYFISSEAQETILKFSRDYDLFNKDNVSFGFVSVDDVLSHFGSISTPSIYIYKETGELVQSFDGLVDVEVVIQYL